MNIDALKRFAANMLRDAIEDLRRKGSIFAAFHLMKRDGGLELYLLDGPVTNSRNMKDQVAAKIRARVASGEITAVVFRSDTFWSEIAPEQDRIRRSFGMNVEEAAAAGLCVAHEGVMVILESPIYHQLSRQEYRRHDGRIELVGDPFVEDDTDPANGLRLQTCRFSNFFSTAREATPA